MPCSSLADDFKYLSISLFGKQIGSIKLRETTYTDIKVIRINGEIYSSPFKVFNGQFEYKTIITNIDNASPNIHYESTVNTTLKQRKVNYSVKNDDLIAVKVLPKKEQTKFTNSKLIDFKFIDPAYFITALLSSPCKSSFVIYDGRRVIDVISTKTASKLECGYLYKIKEGPGHLSPLNFKTFEISTFFNKDRSLASRSLMVKTGPFKLILDQFP